MRPLKILGLICLALICLAPIGFTSCSKSTLAPEGAYNSDKLLYDADAAIGAAYRVSHSFVQFEYENRKALPAEVSQAADVVRKNAEGWIATAILLRDNYERVKSAEAAQKLQAGLAALQAQLADAKKYSPATTGPPTPR